MLMLDDLTNVLDYLKWDWCSAVEEGKIILYISRKTPAGEGFSFMVDGADVKTLIKHIKIYAASFDIDEHVEGWIEAKGYGEHDIPGARELVYDAERIDQMLHKLAELCDKLMLEAVKYK